MRRRSERQLTVDAFLAQVCHAPLDWPGKTTRLERNSLLDYQQRSSSPEVSVAELYHEHSKFYPNMLGDLVATRLKVDDFRKEFIRRRAALCTEEPPKADVDERVLTLLRRTATISPELFYALELRIVAQELLSSYEPGRDEIRVVKDLSANDVLSLRNALRTTSFSKPSADTPILFVIGCFARNEVLFGQRGYRRTLLEAGELTATLSAEAARLNLVATPVFEFLDRDLDAVMEADGTEEGTLVAIDLGVIVNVK